jgi:hypothetical protein
MTGLVRKATLLSVCGLLAAGVAFANVPDPVHSTIVATFGGTYYGIPLGGSDLTTSDPSSQLVVTVKDLANNPIANSTVIVDFSACSDVQICDTQLDGSTADCATKTVRMATNGAGQATFYIVGHADVAADADGSNLGAVTVYADGVNLYDAAEDVNGAGLNAACYDLDGSSGVSGTDLSLWLSDFGLVLANGPERGDYDYDGILSGTDLSGWLTYFGKLQSPFSCAEGLGADCAP